MTPTVRTAEHEEKIVGKLARGWSVSAACKAARIARRTYYYWREEDEGFAALCDDAMEMGTDHLEDIATRQAVAGNTSLMVLLLKARRPHKYVERFVTEQTGPDGGPIRYIVNEVPSPPRPESI